jgi:hypothetical protein
LITPVDRAQCASQSDIQQLDPSPDSQEWHSPLGDGSQQQHIWTRFAHLRASITVALAQILATCVDKCLQTVQHAIQVRLVAQWRHDNGDRAGLPDAIQPPGQQKVRESRTRLVGAFAL